jgi:archaellum component FlaC
MKNNTFEKGLTWVWRSAVVVLLVVLIVRQSDILEGQPDTLPKSNSNVGGQLGSLSGNLSKMTKNVEQLNRDIGNVKNAVEGGSTDVNRALSSLGVKIDQSTLEIERLGRQVSNLD